MDHRKRAVELFREGCNCSQAVFCAFEDYTGIDRETGLKLSCGFGGGLSRLREVCGAVSGMVLAADMIFGYSDISDPSLKSEHYKLIQGLCKRFSDVSGSLICRELLGIKGSSEPYSPPRTEEFYKTRPCLKLIELAAGILEDYIWERKDDGLPSL